MVWNQLQTPVWAVNRGGEGGPRLAAEAEDALDVAGEAALALLLHLVVQRREGHVVEGQVEEQRLAGDWLEVRREVNQVGLLAHQGGVQAEHFQPGAQGLPSEREEGERDTDTEEIERHFIHLQQKLLLEKQTCV